MHCWIKSSFSKYLIAIANTIFNFNRKNFKYIEPNMNNSTWMVQAAFENRWVRQAIILRYVNKTMCFINEVLLSFPYHDDPYDSLYG